MRSSVTVILWMSVAMLVVGGCVKRVATVKQPVPRVQEERVTERAAPPVVPAPSPPGGPSHGLPAPQRPTVGEEGVQEVAKREAVTPGPKVTPALPALQDAFFDFDRTMIRDDAKAPLAADAKRLAGDPGLKVLVEGHADERGSVDYNLVLGEKRAKAVKEYLTALGVAPGRIQTVSYGKERPFCREQTEDCYQQNRRGHFVIVAG